MSSSSSPPRKFSQIAHKFQRWRASTEIKEAIAAREKDVEEDEQKIQSSKEIIMYQKNQIDAKKKWIRDAKEEIRKTEASSKEIDRAVSHNYDQMAYHARQTKEKIDWVEGHKKKFPYEFPEWQIAEDE